MAAYVNLHAGVGKPLWEITVGEYSVWFKVCFRTRERAIISKPSFRKNPNPSPWRTLIQLLGHHRVHLALSGHDDRNPRLHPPLL